jgi:hypothetical protein
MQKERLKNYTFKVPLAFKFKASADLSLEELYKLAEEQLTLALKTKIFDVDYDKIDCVKEEAVYSAEEKEKLRKSLIEILKERDYGI